MPQTVVEIVEYLQFFVVDQGELFTEQNEVVGQGVDVAVESQQDEVPRVTLVYVGEHVEKQSLNLLHRSLERARERVTCTHTQLIDWAVFNVSTNTV